MTRHNTLIDWTHRPGTVGATWNVFTGCTKASPGCDNCYAEAITRRFKHNGGNFEEIVFHEDRLEIPLRLDDPHTFFTLSMGDLFHPDIVNNHRGELERVWDVMRRTPQHTYLILTKRPGLMVAWYEEHGWFENAWAGTSIESQKYAPRIDVLALIPAPVRFVSAEPLLGPVSLIQGTRILKIDWLITGGESGSAARRFDPAWAEQLRLEADAAGVAFFHKQNQGRKDGDELFGRRYKAFPIERRFRVPFPLRREAYVDA